MTIKEIAKSLSISEGTVDRVIHNRGRFSKDTEKKVLNAIEKSGYQINKNGQALAAISKKYKLGVLLYDTAYFNQLMLSGLKSSYKKLQDCGIEIKETIYKVETNKCIINEINKFIKWGANALIIQVINTPEIKQLINDLVEKNIFIITLNTDVIESNRNYFVGYDNYTGGRTAMKILEMIMGGQGNVLLLSGNQSHAAHMERLKGVLSYLKDTHSKINISEFVELKSKDNLQNHINYIHTSSRIDGVLILSIYSEEAIKILNTMEHIDHVKMGAFDLTPDNINLLKSNIIDFVIEQHPFSQGKKAADIVYNYLVLGEHSKTDTWYPESSIVVSENIKEFTK